jgi:putative membrane protein
MTGPVDPRVTLAAERTFLAWVRTALALLGFGLVVAKFDLFMLDRANAAEGRTGSLTSGIGLVVLGVVILVVATVRYRRYVTAYAADPTVPPPGTAFGVGIGAALALAGIATAVALIVLR